MIQRVCIIILHYVMHRKLIIILTLPKAIKAIQVIGNLSNKSNYTYENSDVEKIFRALNAEIRTARQRFETSTSQTEEKYSLD